MAKNFKGMNLLTEKGVVAPKARTAITDYVLSHLFDGSLKENVEMNKKGFEIPFVDESGNQVYARFTLAVSEKACDELAPKKAKTKKNDDEIVIEIE